MKELQNWTWKAADLEGKLLKGTWDYADSNEIRQALRQRGLFPIEIRPKFNTLEKLSMINDSRIKWIRLVKNLALLLEAGVPLLEAIEILANRDSGRMHFSPEQLTLVKNKIQEGLDFSEAISILKPMPDSFIRYRIRAGEQSGTLVEALEEIAASLELDVYYNRKVKAALGYPLILLTLTMIIIIALGIWILPMYEGIFSNFNGELPLLTRIIFGLGEFLPRIILAILFASVGVIGVIGLVPKIKSNLLQGLRSLPLWGSILRLADEEKFSRILVRLLKAGIPILDALKLMRGFNHNLGINELVEDLIFAVNEGRKLTPVLRLNKVFSQDKCEIFRIGEESGKLEESLILISKWARIEFEEKFTEFSRYLEPLMIIIMAIIIGLVAVGVLLPVLQASSYLNT